MAETKATRKELFARIKETMAGDPEVAEMCDKYIEQLSKKRETKAQKAAAEFAETVRVYMAEAGEPLTNREIAENFGVSGQKITGALRKLMTLGTVVRINSEKSTEAPRYAVA